jgi:hypothetical protein
VRFESGSILREIGESGFGNIGLKCIHIPASVEGMGESAFGHSAISVAGFEPNSVVREIGTEAFKLTTLIFIEIPAFV